MTRQDDLAENAQHELFNTEPIGIGRGSKYQPDAQIEDLNGVLRHVEYKTCDISKTSPVFSTCRHFNFKKLDVYSCNDAWVIGEFNGKLSTKSNPGFNGRNWFVPGHLMDQIFQSIERKIMQGSAPYRRLGVQYPGLMGLRDYFESRYQLLEYYRLRGTPPTREEVARQSRMDYAALDKATALNDQRIPLREVRLRGELIDMSRANNHLRELITQHSPPHPRRFKEPFDWRDSFDRLYSEYLNNTNKIT
jgi:hypothetical protein